MEIITNSRTRILYVDGHTLYAQIGNKSCSSNDYGNSWSESSIKLIGNALSYSKLHNRLMRKGIYCLKILKNGRFLFVIKGGIYNFDHINGYMDKSFSISRGSRPLFLCENQDGDIFFGEYYNNPKRDEVNIYVLRSSSGSWEVAYKFKKNNIRHVHGVFYDIYDNKLWVTTGDRDNESALWFTDNQFKTLEKAISGSQQSRALQLLFTKDYVYFGTDTPFEINHIYRLEKSSGKVEKLISVDSSVYWGCKVGEYLFFSTAVEPSKVNKSRYACIWGSSDGKTWKCVAKFKKDTWPMKYFQIGQIFFPQGENKTDYLFFTPFATENDQTLQRMKVSNLF